MNGLRLLSGYKTAIDYKVKAMTINRFSPRFSSNKPSRFSSSFSSPFDIANSNPNLKQSLELFESNRIQDSLEIALREYHSESSNTPSERIFVSSRREDESNRPAYAFLSSLLASLGPKHPETIRTLALMKSTSEEEEATPFIPRIIQKRHGGYPVRLNNGKWTWQGPHWSRHNNRTWKTGYSSDFTYGMGK